MKRSWLLPIIGIVIGAALMEVSTPLGGTVLFVSGWAAGMEMASWE